MSARTRIASVAVASATVTGFCAPVGLAANAGADPCTGAAAAAQPPADQAFRLPSPSAHEFVPRGRKPAGANDQAPLPKLGQLSKAILNSLIPGSAPVKQQAAVAPSPNPPVKQPTQTPSQPAAQIPPAPDLTGPATTSLVGWVTGPDSPDNTIRRFGISGADLGIMWDNGDPAHNQVLIAFGDTYGYCTVPGQQWRYNTLLRTQDRSLAGGIDVANGVVSDSYSGSPVWRPGLSKQVINSIKTAQSEEGIIPTAGVAVGRAQYLNFMSVKDWVSNGQWTTNFSAIAVSGDNGQNWGVYPGTIRMPEAGNENFQQGAFLRPGPGDPYLYSIGTPPGRSGSAYIARVAPPFVPDLTKYEYWNADRGWVPSDPAAATPVIPGPVGEMSAQFNTYLKRYLVLYSNGGNDVVARTAPAPQGPWGPEQMLVSSMQFPGGIYAPYLHPWSTGKELYFNLSLWSAYNVMLMHTVLP
ncbi:MAG TPA: DUF4185 domain-containing protein [Mycobacterium sp.]